MFMTAKSELIKRFRERFSPEPVIKIVQDTDAMPAIKQVINWVVSWYVHGDETRSCCVSEFTRVGRLLRMECFVRKVPTNQKCLEERDASAQNSNLQNMHSRQISDAILDAMFNKLPYEYEFENLVNISPLKCALKSFTLVLVFCCMTFFNSVHHFENNARYLRVEESRLLCTRFGEMRQFDFASSCLSNSRPVPISSRVVFLV